MKTRLTLTLLLATVACGALDGAAQVSIKRGEPKRAGNNWEERAECSAALRETGRLLVRADLGSIRVTPGAGENMSCQVRVRVYRAGETEARRFLRSFELSLRPHEGGLVLRGSVPADGGGHRKFISAEYEITVPARTPLDLETQGGDIQVGNMKGAVQAVTAGGDIETGDIRGSVRLETAGGGITVGSVMGPVEARTAGGAIRVGDVTGAAVLETSGGEINAGMVTGNLRAETAGGDLVLRGASGALEAQTAGGQIRIGETGGSVVAQTAGGSIRVNGSRGRVDVKTAGGSIDLLQLRNAVNASTAAGSIVAQIDAAQKTFPASKFETAAGDIRIYIPSNLPVSIEAVIDMASGHKIVSDFPLKIQGDGPELSGARVRGEGMLNGGGEVLRIRTTAGDIEIRRLDPQTFERLRAQQETFWKRWQAREDQLKLAVQRPR